MNSHQEVKPGSEIVLRQSQVGILLDYKANGYSYYVKDDPKKKPLYKGGKPVKHVEKERQTA